MAFIRSQVFCVFVSVFVVFFCVDLAYRVEGDVIVKIANIGDNITLSCYRPGYDHNYKWWYRNGTLIANWNGFFVNDPRFTQGVTDYSGIADTNSIYINNIRMNDSASFRCFDYYNETVQSYDLRVIRCSNCIIANHSNPDKIKVICLLDNYRTSQTLSRYVILNGSIYHMAVVQGSAFSFPIYVTELNRLRPEFYLQIETVTRIACMLSTQPMPPSSLATTMLPTTSLKQTTQNRPSTLSYYTASQKMPVGRPTSISTTQHHTPTNKIVSSDKNTRDGNITLIIIILGSVFILILIVIIIVQRWKKTKDRQENKHIDNASIKKEHPKVCYESVEDGSRKDPEYATSIKELRGTNRDLKSTSNVTDGSSASDHLYGNNAIITQHEQIMGTRQQGDWYDDVKMPGSGGDAEEIPLYEMPDKGPTRNTLKATLEAGQTPILPTDEVVSVDALYVEVD